MICNDEDDVDSDDDNNDNINYDNVYVYDNNSIEYDHVYTGNKLVSFPLLQTIRQFYCIYKAFADYSDPL